MLGLFSAWKKDSAQLRSAETDLWKKAAIGLLLLAISALISYAWWPIRTTPNENDAVRISFGAAQQIFDTTSIEAYRYESQSGTYQSIIGVSRLLNQKVQPLLVFRLLTIASFLVFAAASAQLLHALLGCPRWFGFASLMLFQETFIASYYPNSNMLAIPWGVLALALLANKVTWSRSTVAGVLYGIGIWMRIDLVLICLAFPILMKPRLKEDWTQVGLVTVVSIVVSNTLIWFSGVSLSQVILEYQKHASNSQDAFRTLQMYGTAYTALTIVTLTTGLIWLYRQRNWQMLALVATGVLPTIAAFGFSVTTPKYLLYSLVFASIASTSGLWWLIHSTGQSGKVLVGTLFLVQYVANPFAMLPNQGILHTADMNRRLGGIYASSVDWHDESLSKAVAAQRLRKRVVQSVRVNPHAVVVMQDYTLEQLVPYFLLLDGYQLQRVQSESSASTFQYDCGASQVTLVMLHMDKKTPLSHDEIARLGIDFPTQFHAVGYLNPDMLPAAGKPKVRGTGKFGMYTVRSLLVANTQTGQTISLR